MLSLKNLSKRFGSVAAVDSVTLDVSSGQMVGIIGRSGAGKSTLLRLVNRLAEPTDGVVNFRGTNITDLRGRKLLKWRSECAMIFQHFNLVPRLDVLTNVLLGAISTKSTLPSLFKHFTAGERALAIEALERMDMAGCALQRADTLSGGQQQRVAIARALMQHPSIILADEPIASLDPRNAARVMDALRKINREDGITVLCNLHTLDTARACCDRVVGMVHGRIVFDGPPEALNSAAVRRIYQTDDDTGEIDESITSVSVSKPHVSALAPA